MITFASKATTSDIRQMWKTVFGDTDEYIDLYFTRKYKPENTLVYLEENKPVASLQMLPYTITFYGKRLNFYYLMGLCTLPEYRRRGYMEQLILHSHEIMQQRQIPLSVLVPAEDWLFGFYEKYGYEKVFEKDNRPIPLAAILEQHPDIEEAYAAFGKLQQQDFYVQKNFEDFETIVDEYRIDSHTPRTNLSAMAHIIDTKVLLSIYAQTNRSKKFTIQIDKEKYQIENGKCTTIKDESCDLMVDSRLLCRLLFGFRIDELEDKYQKYFSRHHPTINLMLE